MEDVFPLKPEKSVPDGNPNPIIKNDEVWAIFGCCSSNYHDPPYRFHFFVFHLSLF